MTTGPIDCRRAIGLRCWSCPLDRCRKEPPQPEGNHPMKKLLTAAAAAAAIVLTGVSTAGTAHAYGITSCTDFHVHSRVFWVVAPNDVPFEGTIMQLHQKWGTAVVAWDDGITETVPLTSLTTCNPVTL